MSTEVGQLRASLSANSAAFASDMKRARDAVRKNASGMEAAMYKVQDAFTGTISAINKMGGYAAAAAVGGMAVFVKKQIDIADEMGKMAQKTGTTTEWLSTMGLVASQSGASLEVIGKSIQKLSKNMDDASKGIGEAKDAFLDLGIAVKDSTGVLRPANDVMLDIANKFSGMEDGANKTALAMQLFGKSGTELIPALNMGAAGIQELQQKARDLGLEISTKTALEAAYLNDQLDILTQTAVGTGRGIALGLIPWLNDAVAAIRLAKEDSGTLMAAWVALGAVGSALFTKSVTQEITDMEGEIARLEERIALLKKTGTDPSAKVILIEEGHLTELKGELQKLTEQRDASAKAEQSAMEASLKQQQEDADARRKNTEAMIAQSEARLRDAQLSAQAVADEKKRIAELKAEQERAVSDQEKEKERLTARLENLKEHFATETELALMAYNERAAAIQELEDANIGTEMEREELRLQVAQEYADRMLAIEAKAANDRARLKEAELRSKQQAEQNFWRDSTSLMASGSKAMFEIGKGAAIAKAIIDGYSAATSAFAAGMSVGGPWAPAVAAAYTAASLARTSAMISSIRGASFSGGSGGGLSASGGGVSVSGGSVGSVSTGKDFNGGAPQVPTQRELRVVVEGDGPHSQSMRKLLVDLATTAEDMGGINKLVIG